MTKEQQALQASQIEKQAEITTSNWTPTSSDRCDWKDCPAQAYIKITGVSGDLLFCNHHYNRAEPRIQNFAFKVDDRRDLLR